MLSTIEISKYNKNRIKTYYVGDLQVTQEWDISLSLSLSLSLCIYIYMLTENNSEGRY